MKYKPYEVVFITIGLIALAYAFFSYMNQDFVVVETGHSVAPDEDIWWGEESDVQAGGRVMAPKDVTLAPGQSADALGLSITLNSVPDDYRCPVDVVCIQAGAINTNITLATDDKSETQNYSSDGVPLVWEGYKISIVDMGPGPYAGQEIAQDDYRVTYHIESAYTGIVDNPDAEGGTVPAGDSASQCAAVGGQYDAAHGECLGVGGSACAEIGGVFNECASACRNDKDAEVCTMQCIQVCEL